MNTKISSLPNGLRVVTTEMPAAQSVSVNIFVGTGSRYENKHTNGAAHYLEHMLFKGTNKRPTAMLISEAIEGAGGRTNAFTTHEVTCFLAKVPFEKSDLALDVISDMVLDALLDPEEVERERHVVIEEIRRSWDNPGAWAGELAYQAIFGDQPLGWDVAGTEDTVNGISRQDLVDYVSTWYVPNNEVVSVAGNVKHERVVELMEKAYANAKPHEVSTFQPVKPRGEGAPIKVETRKITQATLVMNLLAPGRKDPERYILTVLSNLLGSGMSSRLFKEVRERRGLAYSVGCGVSRFYDIGLMSASAGVSPEKVVETAKVILDEFQKLVDEPVGDEELTKARDYSVGSFRLGLEDTMSVARYAGDQLLALGEIKDVDFIAGQLAVVTSEDIQRMARRLFENNEVAMAMTGPNDETEALTKLIAK